MADARSGTNQFTVWHTIGLIALFLFALYPGVFLGTDSFFYRDFGLFTYPAACYSHQNFWHGQVPLWNPLNNCGVPFLAQWNTSVCYPPSLVYLLLPLPWSLNLFLIGHLVLAGAGMYLLAYRWTQNRAAASIAGLVFALNGLTFNCLLWTSNLAALSWQPFVVLWAEQAWQRGGRRLVPAVLAGAMQMLAGAPEIIVFTWVILGALWLGQTWRREISFGLSLRRFLTVVVLIAALSAIQLLPFFDLLKHSQRDSSYDIANTWPMPVWGWANFVVPMFRCARTALGTFFQDGQSWTSSYYLGMGALAFAAMAVWRFWRRPRICGLVVATLVGLVLALGNNGYVYTWLKQILPWIGFARYPIKFVALPIFTLPLLAAFGFTGFESLTTDNPKQGKRALALVTILLLLAIAVILTAARWQTDPQTPWQPAWASGAMRVLFLIAIVGCLLLWFRLPATRLRAVVGLGLLALIGFDLVTAGANINPVVTTKAFGPLELNMSARPEPFKSRAMVSPQVAAYIDSAGTSNALYYYVSLRGTLF
ncbi:MAG TPA: hypothetical protein VKA67_03565, partial [Verrucomicrobiae bacterium]|nr:hypothetical protein [Verrucomicrobiae bacterium]